MACGVSTVARLALFAVLASGACRKSESDTGLPLDSAAMPSGVGDTLAPAGTWKPPSGDFGAVTVGQESPPQTFRFTNDGEQAAGPLATRLGGPDGPSFLLAEDLCAGASLPAAGTCAVTLRFKPLAAGELAASLTLTAPARGSAILVVGGTGVTP
jgi:hypothetical protein